MIRKGKTNLAAMLMAVGFPARSRPPRASRDSSRAASQGADSVVITFDT